ncbi:MAG: helix-turn-helix domain-containing protein [Candidatus Levybacteria bacterium]|nr:helix-turn-helix domain-containing protein [Candidatus Levybacteria bacterium]
MTEESKIITKKQILERLTKNFTISSACHAVGIDRKTFYRWIEEDIDFKLQAYDNIQESKKDVTDVAYTRLVKHIENGNLTAVMYWLNNKDPEISDKAIYISEEEIEELSTLLYNPNTFKKGQELLTSYVLRGKISERYAQLILKIFLAQMKVEDIMTRKAEADVMSEVLFRNKMNKLQRK